MNDSGEQGRFHTDKLHVNTSAVFEHFHPFRNGRDRFGNRIFQSPDLAYLTRREKIPTRAALLISPDGANFIKGNTGILRDIDKGLTKMERVVHDISPDDDVSVESVSLGNGRKMDYLGSGSASKAFTLGVGSEKYVVKVRNTIIPESQSYFQPYINEMLQLQAMQVDLKEEFEARGIRLPTYFFASGQIGCVNFVEGNSPSAEEIRKIVHGDLYSTVSEYIHYQKQQNNSLWQNVSTDLLNPQHLIEGRADNFVKNSDGTFTWIDPLVFTPNWTAIEMLKLRASEGDPQAIEMMKRFGK